MIYIIDRSEKVDTGDIMLMVHACNIQMMQHVAPLWGLLSEPLVFAPEVTAAPPGSKEIVIFDAPDDASALGYHMRAPDGNMYAKVFADPILKHGGTVLHGGPYTVASVLSHEVIEMLIDPWTTYWVDTEGRLVHKGQTWREVAMEACDPVEADLYTIDAGRPVSVSNFVLPSWFNCMMRGKKVDYMNRCKGQPFSCSSGGYLIVRNQIGIEQQIFASEGEYYPEWKKDLKSNFASRTYKRGILNGLEPVDLNAPQPQPPLAPIQIAELSLEKMGKNFNHSDEGGSGVA